MYGRHLGASLHKRVYMVPKHWPPSLTWPFSRLQSPGGFASWVCRKCLLIPPALLRRVLQLFGARPQNQSCLSCLRSNTRMEDTFLLGNPRYDSPMEHSHSWACDNYLFISIIVNKYCSGRLPWWLSSKESACNAGDTGDSGSIPGSERSPGGGHGNSLAGVLAGESHGRRSLVGCSPWGRRVRRGWNDEHAHTHCSGTKQFLIQESSFCSKILGLRHGEGGCRVHILSKMNWHFIIFRP